MRPWIVAPIGLLLAIAAIYALVTGVFEGDDASEAAIAATDEIDSRSRAELRDLLRESEAEAKP